ncbi:MAG: hypothetical protein R2694_02110 [Ilumatobacteraceae bacterium]
MATRRSDLERWFIRRGVPHFIEPYAAGRDIWSRAVPLLVVAYVAGGLNGLDLAHWTWQRNLAAAAVVVAILLATWFLTNLLRRRPLLARPRALGWPELAVFLLGPALPSLVFAQWGDAVQAVVEGAAVLAVIYVVTSYGLIPITGWAASQTFRQVGPVGRMMARALPLLLLFTTFLFINAEVWQVAGTLDGPVYLVVLALFFVLGTAFMLSRVPAAIRVVNDFDDWAEVTRLVAGTPAEDIGLPAHGDPMEIPLSPRQRLNLGLVSVFSQAILVTIVALTLFVFFVVFGLLAIPEATTAFWTATQDVHVLTHWRVGGRTLVITEPLLRVAGFLAAFSGMYFTVVLGTDATYREEFARDAGPEIRQALAVRLAYHHAAAGD